LGDLQIQHLFRLFDENELTRDGSILDRVYRAENGSGT
jgi:hypothetical protein